MSEKVTAPLVALILQQSHVYTTEAKAEQLRAKRVSHALCRQQEAVHATELKNRLPEELQKVLTVSLEKVPQTGSSLYPYRSMDLLSTKGPLVMHCAHGMVGDHKLAVSLQLWKTVHS